MILEWIIGIFLVVTFLCGVVLTMYIERQSNKYKYGEHFCNHCKRGYVLTDEDLARTHCKNCGRKLTKHEQDPNFCEVEDEENGNEENPFPDI